MRVLLMLALCLPACGQIVEATGGHSTLMGGTGAGLTAYLPGSTVYAGAGCLQAHCGFALSDSFHWRGWDVTAGDSTFGFALDGAGLSTQVRGLNFQRVRPQQTTSFFVGSSALGYSTSFFTANRAQHVGAGFFYRRRLGRWQFGTLEEIKGGKRTAIEGAGYTSLKLRASITGGLLDNMRLLNALADYQPLRELHFGGGHVNYFYPVRVTSDSVSASAGLGHVTALASATRSTTDLRAISGTMLGGAARFGPASLQVNYYAAAGSKILTQTAQEHITRRWTLSQTASEQAGHASFGAGGGYHSNRIAVAVDHSMTFTTRGWQKVTSLQISIKLPHTDASLNVGTLTLPTGETKYTLSGTSWQRGPLNLQAAAPRHATHRKAAGRFVISGTVVDKQGLPVSGAAIALGKDMVYSDTRGSFAMRLRKAQPVLVRVLTDQFVTPGAYVVISAPDCAAPGTPVTIVVSTN
jgi:hypothetical protein